MPRPPEIGGAADDHGGDHLQLEADARVRLHVGNWTAFSTRRQAGQRAHHHEDAEDDAPRADAEQPRRLGVGAGRRRPRGRRASDAQAPGDAAKTSDRGGRRSATRPPAWPRPNHWKLAGRSCDPGALRRPAQRLAQRDHRRQRHDDRRQPEPGDERAVDRAQRRARRRPRRPRPAASGSPALASRPATTPQIANCEPIEMSIWRARMTSVMPDRGDEHRRVGRPAGRAGWPARRSDGRRDGEHDEQHGEGRGHRRARARSRGDAARRERRRRAAWPSASARIRSWRRRAARSSVATIVPPCITAMRSLMPRISGSSDEIIRMARPSRGQLAHQAVDLGLGAHVDALRRLVEDQHRGLRRQPARERHLLLVAAGEVCRPACRATAALIAKRSTNVPASAPLPRRVEERPARRRAQDGERGVRGHRHLEDHAVAPAVLGDVGDAERDGLRGRVDASPCGRGAAISPASAGVRPKRTRASSVRPAPTSPARPRISPARTSRSTSRTPADAARQTARGEHDVADRDRRASGRPRRARGRPSADQLGRGRASPPAACRHDARRRAARSRGRRSAAPPPAGARCRRSRPLRAQLADDARAGAPPPSRPARRWARP